MGAGNRYTLEENSSVLAAYVDTSCDCWEEEIHDCDCAEYQLQMLKGDIEELPLFDRYGWDDSRNSCYYGERYKIVIKHGNHNELVIDFEYQQDCEQVGLQEYHYEAAYHKVIRLLNKNMTLCVGHGYTHSEYKAGQYK